MDYAGGRTASGSSLDSHSILRSRGAGTGDAPTGPRLWEFILIPWLCVVVILLTVLVMKGCSSVAVWLPALLLMLVCLFVGVKAYRKGSQGQAVLALLCMIACVAAFVVGLISHVHFLSGYCDMGQGASYTNVLPSESGASKADATAITFAEGTHVDDSRTYGYVDARNPSGTVYCVAPMANQWTQGEQRVSFFAAGKDCCNARGNFACSEAGNTARGALKIALEMDAEQGYIEAVRGAVAAYNIQPDTNYMLVHVVDDPSSARDERWTGALRLCLIFIAIILIIMCMVGFFADRNIKQ